MSDWDEDAYDLLDPKHPSYHERMADWGDQLRKAKKEEGPTSMSEVAAEGEAQHDDHFRARGYCEDFPCCGHEAGDCYGQKYGTNAEIKQRVYDQMNEDDDHPREEEE